MGLLIFPNAFLMVHHFFFLLSHCVYDLLSIFNVSTEFLFVHEYEQGSDRMFIHSAYVSSYPYQSCTTYTTTHCFVHFYIDGDSTSMGAAGPSNFVGSLSNGASEVPPVMLYLSDLFYFIFIFNRTYVHTLQCGFCPATIAANFGKSHWTTKTSTERKGGCAQKVSAY